MAQYTAEEVRSWTKMEEARDRAAGRFGENSALAVLCERIRSGLIPTASLRWTHQLGERGVPHPETDPRIVTTEDWTAYRGVLPRNLWRGEAQFIYPSKTYSPDRHMQCFEIVCDPAALDVEFPRPDSTETPNAVREIKNAGGRPARDDWDDILAATAGEMLGGRLIPKRASDVEKFMLQWASDKGKPIGTTAVKSPAKKLFEVFKKEVGN